MSHLEWAFTFVLWLTEIKCEQVLAVYFAWGVGTVVTTKDRVLLIIYWVTGGDGQGM